MEPMTLAAILSAIPGLGQTVLGAIDRVKGRKIDKQPLDEWKEESGVPEYDIPESYDEYLGLKKTNVRQQMPGYEQMKSDIGEATAQTLSGAQNLSGADSAAVLLGAQQNRLSALRQMGLMAMQYREGKQSEYENALMGRAPYEEKGFEYNQWLPWQIKKNEAMSYWTGGNQNIISGLDQLGAVGTNYANMQAQQNWYNSMYPQQQPQPYTSNYNWQQQSPQFYNQMQQAQPMFTSDPYSMGYSAPQPPSLM